MQPRKQFIDGLRKHGFSDIILSDKLTLHADRKRGYITVKLGINDKNVMAFDTKSEYLAWSEPIAWAIEHGYLESEPTW